MDMKKIILSSFVFFFIFIAASPVFAEGLIVCGGKGQKPCELCDILVLFEKIVDFLLINPGIVPIVAALMVAVGGAMFLLGGVDPKMVNQAKSLLTSVVWGLLIIYGAWVFVNTFFMLIGLNEAGTFGFNLKNWWNFPCP